MATRKNNRNTSPASTLVDDDENEDEEEEQQDDEVESTSKRPRSAQMNQMKSVNARNAKRGYQERAPVIRLARQVHDPSEDWEVEHSGTDDPNGGPPKYDESPIKGGMIIASNHLHMVAGEVVNANGHEIDPDDLDHRGHAVVIEPDRYKDDEETL